MARPWIVMVTGEPGSGKTTLGLRLAEALRVPFLSRDHVRGGLLATAGLWTNSFADPSAPPPRSAAVDALVTLLEAFAAVGVTVVIEFVVTPDRVEAMRRIEAMADCLVVRTVCDAARSRADQRDRADPLLNRAEVLAALGHSSIDSYVGAPERASIRDDMQSSFDLPMLTVTTDDGYQPALPDIVDWVIGQTARRSSAARRGDA